MYRTWPRIPKMNGSSSRYRVSYSFSVTRVPFGSFCSVNQRRPVTPWFWTRSFRTAASLGIDPVLTSSVPPCQVTLIVAPARWASSIVLTNEFLRSGSFRSASFTNMRTNCGCSPTIFDSISRTFSGVTPASRLIYA